MIKALEVLKVARLNMPLNGNLATSRNALNGTKLSN